ncbi:RnfABCDGE type electron transport complex subunit D [Treponema phagedenis]|uniref:Ion-translocating oxidoreductase complex subunit D n=1 Tax=Treponema phagedenis TaxID=162 RepID=A0A0B7GUH1_TREPH|nr:RnfABCDGE type electron transport complex subunit D [Treponema phagedenis]EFW37500.1 electron transport complex, RnfABCDGE type, D subunit [Treponema phagedenis F0421]NVP24750.1 RnfABCDGE type electron transport complex subunit D [Treponema phagedenis]QEJ95863.1 RnfABCDGE type electron transport complex subunit D [Treponema phagedenis]QEJ98866.1 RnfABCDGE type electron transport complex subunit D [Treponema phagedenis]QEK00442.1 RnfABCDGE type electron transport complex subunit D [Treponema
MAESDKNEIFLSPAPHIVNPVTTQKLMMYMLLALVPQVAFSVYIYSMMAFSRICLSVLTTVATEAIYRRVFYRDSRVSDLSAVVTGTLLGLVIPPTLPIIYIILGGVFAIIVGKEFFGGLGANPFNPALLGRAFMFVSFLKPMTSWISTKNWRWDIVGSATTQNNMLAACSSATPLGFLKPGGEHGLLTATQLAEKLGYSSANDLYLHMFIGDRSGCVGESSILLILLSAVFLIVMKVIDWRTPVSMIVTTVVISFLAGVDPLLSLMSGGLVFGAVFMATDYATTPVTPLGRIGFGMGCGIITALIRLFAGIPEGVMYSILIMNAFVPFLDRLIPKKYGFVKKPRDSKKGESK